MSASPLASQTQAALEALREKRDAAEAPWMKTFLTARIEEAERILSANFERPYVTRRRLYGRA